LKDSVIGIIFLGAVGSIVASVITHFATTNQDYSWVKILFTSTINIPSWVLLLLIMLPASLIYILVVLLKNRKTIENIKSTKPKKIKKDKRVDHSYSDDIWINYFIEERYEDAKKEIQKTLHLKAEDKKNENITWLSYINYKINKNNNNIGELIDISKKYKDDINVSRLIAQFLLWENSKSEAINFIELSLKKFPSDSQLTIFLSEIYRKSYSDKAIKVLEETDINNTPLIAIKLSEIYFENKKINKAIQVLMESHAHNPRDIEVMFTLSEYLAEDHKHKEALYLLNILLQKSPNNSQYWALSSNRCLDLNLYNKAMIMANKANMLSEKGEDWLLANIGNIFNRRGLYSQAILWLEKSLKLNPSLEYAHDRMATALKEEEKENDKYNEFCNEGGKLLHGIEK